MTTLSNRGVEVLAQRMILNYFDVFHPNSLKINTKGIYLYMDFVGNTPPLEVKAKNIYDFESKLIENYMHDNLGACYEREDMIKSYGSEWNNIINQLNKERLTLK